MADYDLISGEYYYQYWNHLSGDAQEMAHVQQTITAASSYCEEYCNRPFLAGGLVPIPIDSAGDEISTYAYYDSIDDVPLDIKHACCILVRWYCHIAAHMGTTATKSGGVNTSYEFVRPMSAMSILKRYKYFPDQP